jgi:hypothetical protein
MTVITKDVATAEVNKWLDFKGVNERKRASFSDSIESLSDSIQDGVLVVDDKCNIIQTLIHPIWDVEKIKTLTYMPRINVGKLKQNMTGVKSLDADGRIVAYVAALTGQTKAMIEKLDSEDYSVSQSIAVFFL